MQLSANALSGNLPGSLAGLSGSLGLLDVSSNAALGGPIDVVGSLTGLYVLLLSAANFTGTVPASLGGLTQLKYLFLQQNGAPVSLAVISRISPAAAPPPALTGTIPSSLGNLTNVLDMGLFLNRLSGTLPPQLSSLTSMLSFWAHHNNLSGTIPAAYGSLSLLQALCVGAVGRLMGWVRAAVSRRHVPFAPQAM